MRKNFYFKKREIVEYIESQPNQSHYISSLVEADMYNNKNIKDEIKELLEQYLSCNTMNKTITEFKDDINNILDI